MSKACTKCGATELKSLTPSLYHYKISGLENVYLKGGVTESICPKCGTKSTTIKNVVGLHQAIAEVLATAKRRLAGSELRFLREKLGFSAEDIANLVEYNEDHIRKIESGSQVPKAPYEMFLRVAVMRGVEAPGYDLRDLVDRKEYRLEEMKFVNRNHEWQISRAA